MEHKNIANLSSYLSLKKPQNPWLKTNVIMPAMLKNMDILPSNLRRIQNGIVDLAVGGVIVHG